VKLENSSRQMSSDEAAERAANLEAEAASMPVGRHQRDILLQANSYRNLAMLKAFLKPEKVRQS
jgi:hypothetical protein